MTVQELIDKLNDLPKEYQEAEVCGDNDMISFDINTIDPGMSNGQLIVCLSN